ncbi:MAG: hypothetical protein WAS21_09165 [Geminicoccaceae bacterium]
MANQVVQRTATVSKSVLIIPIACVMFITTTAIAETLSEYAKRCDKAVGISVRTFNCNKGTEVPTDNYMPDAQGNSYPHGSCDRPNQLSQRCDKGSKFQLLYGTPPVYIVAHCRKKGLGDNEYGDIAVIQHNEANGATCFYQSHLTTMNGTEVIAPSETANPWPHWKTPLGTVGDGCIACHDNGPIIRSPYLAQMRFDQNRLPGAGVNGFNQTQPYRIIGNDFANWKAYSVEIDGNTCLLCHRLGVSNISGGSSGTAIEFAKRSTAATMMNKNLHSTNSPIWMPPQTYSNDVMYNEDREKWAKAISDCARRVTQNPLPNDASTCRIRQFSVSGDPPPDWGKVVYVDLSFSCSECGDGTVDRPYNDLNRSLLAAARGAVMMLRPGTYQFTNNAALRKQLTFRRWGDSGIVRFVRFQS